MLSTLCTCSSVANGLVSVCVCVCTTNVVVQCTVHICEQSCDSLHNHVNNHVILCTQTQHCPLRVPALRDDLLPVGSDAGRGLPSLVQRGAHPHIPAREKGVHLLQPC